MLPVDPGAEALHYLLVDAGPHPVERLLLELQRLGVVFPPLVVVQVLLERFPGLQIEPKQPATACGTLLAYARIVFTGVSSVQGAYILIAYLRVYRFVRNVGVFLVARTLVVNRKRISNSNRIAIKSQSQRNLLGIQILQTGSDLIESF